MDDNGDQRGTPADWFDGVRAVRRPKVGHADGVLANQVFLQRGEDDARLTAQQRTDRDELEKKLDLLRSKKSELTEEQYLSAIEPILVSLARLYGSDPRDEK